jgi:hypothetical protein
MTVAPSPIAAPTRLTDPERTSPTANTPGRHDSSDAPFSAPHAAPVTTKPLRSTSIPEPRSQSVSGSAPANRNRWRQDSEVARPCWRQVIASSPPATLPCKAVTSAMFGVAAMRSTR